MKNIPIGLVLILLGLIFAWIDANVESGPVNVSVPQASAIEPMIQN